MSEVQQLKKCSRCHCNILLETYFSKNRKGQYNKTCDRCRVRCKCPHCEYTCSKNSNLNRHIKRIHNKIKDFQCPHCDHKCSENGNLLAHIKQIHTKIKDFECGLCNYKCSTNGHLQRHIKQVHTKVKDFECPTCDYKCSDNGHLQRHIKRIHTKIKNVQCPTCDYKCSTNSDLQTHIKQIHSKVKDCLCPTCDYKCSTNSHLQRHILICVGDEQGSSGEVKIKKVLNEMKIDYQYNSSHEVRSDKGLLRWDFIINGDEPLFIEYDGKQHFEPVSFGGISKERAEKAFEKTKKYDTLKDDYCNDNGYLLLRIPYTEYEHTEKLVVEFIRDNTNWGYE